MRMIRITETATGNVVGDYTINLHHLNAEVMGHEWFDEAWRCAVEDGAVPINRRDDYIFAFVPMQTP